MDFNITNLFWLAIPAFSCYLIGSVSFGLIFTKLAGLSDIRTIGSGNTGATNVLRTGNCILAALTLLCDMLKGLLPVLFFSIHAKNLGVIAGFFSFLGHIFPIWFGFKGGKGVATYLGILIGLSWPCAIIFGITWLLIAFISRYSSLAALASVIVTLFFIFSCSAESTFGTITLMSVIIILKHCGNIKRLYRGVERKFEAKLNTVIK